MTFAERYGPWALVAGASQGLGLAYANEVASRGLDVIMLAEADDPLDTVAGDVAARHGVEARPVVADLARPDIAELVADAVQGLDVGLLVYNAAVGYVGEFVDGDPALYGTLVDVNCRGAALLCRLCAPHLVERGRGGLVVMGSAAGLAGTSSVATYSASKAFDIALGEALWRELGPHGVDVVTPVAGTIDTPNLRGSDPDPDAMIPPAAPAVVAAQALDGLGQGPRVYVGDAGLEGLDGMPRDDLVDLLGTGTDTQYRVERGSRPGS